jgi:choline-sulfatase
MALLLGGIALLVLAVAGFRPIRAWWYERAMLRTPGPLDVLLITLDTTRADRIGAYGWPQAETPHLDALAARGTLFREAYAHVPLTAPSHASLFTGLLPTRHGMRDNGTYVLDSRFASLAERFHGAGYTTAAIVSAFVLDRRFGLGRGFDSYDDRLPGSDADRSGDPSERSVRAGATIDKAIAWLKRPDTRPRFLWVHLYDPHFPYDPPEPFAGRHRDRLYDGEIAYMDAQIGRLLDAAAASGRPALRVVTADHGEGLGDHEELTHGYFVYRETQRVPLIVSLPGRVPSGQEIGAIVRSVDIAPTILELSGLPPLNDIDGRSLVPLLAGRATDDVRPAYLESFHPRIWWGAQELLALRTGKWLYVEAPRPELYDVDADPAERTNLAASQPQAAEVLRLQLRTYATPGAPLGAQTRPDGEAASRLRSLGYLGSGAPDDAGGRDLPDAKDNGPLLAAVSEGQELRVQGKFDEALGRFRAALARNPKSLSVRLSVAELLLALGKHDEAFTAYGDIAAAGGAVESAYLGMMQTRVKQGKVEEALAVTTAGLDLLPSSGQLHAERGDLLLRLGRLPEAETAFRRALSIAPDNEKGRWGLGVVLAKQGRRDESVQTMLALAERSPLSPQARAAAPALLAWADERMDARAPADARRGYQAVLDAGQSSPELFLNLGLALWQLGEREEALRILEQGAAKHTGSAELAYRRGRILQQLGRKDAARLEFLRALKLDPQHAAATAALGGR